MQNVRTVTWHKILYSFNSISPDLWRRYHPRARTKFRPC